MRNSTMEYATHGYRGATLNHLDVIIFNELQRHIN